MLTFIKNLNISYPTFLLNSILSFNYFNNVDSISSNILETDNIESFPVHVNIPFISDITSKLIKISTDIPNNKIANTKVLAVSNMLSKLKRKDKGTSFSKLVYSLPCSNCNKIHIGQTSQSLSRRLALHERCVLAEHIYTSKHNIDLNRLKILTKQQNKMKICFQIIQYSEQEN